MSLGEYIGAGSGTTKLLLHLNGNSTDSSGNGNNGTDGSGVSYVAGKFGQAANFDGGVNAYINCGSGASIDQLFASGATFIAWVNPDGNEDNKRIVSKNNNTSSGWHFNLRYSTGYKIEFFVGGSTTNGQWDTTNNTAITAGEWHMVAVTYNSSLTSNDPIIYVDGSPVGITEVTTPVSINSDAGNNLEIGGYASVDRNIDGKIDEVIYENRIWTPAEIKKYYTYAKGRFGIL